MAYTSEDIFEFLNDGQKLDDADFSDAKLAGLQVPKIHLKGASFRNADLRYANLAGANLEEADFSGAQMEGIKLTGANLKKAIFEGSQMENAQLVRADLRGASLEKADLTFSSFKSAKLHGANFTDTRLRKVNLSGAEGCLMATFDGADLSEARVRFTGIDKFELGKGVKFDGTTGLQTNIFKFIIKCSWTEFMPKWKSWLLFPFYLIKWIFVGLFRLITLPLRFFH